MKLLFRAPKVTLPQFFEVLTHDIERVGRKYRLRNRQPHERVEFRKSQPAYATYDAHQAQAKMGRAAHEIVNRFDAVTNETAACKPSTRAR